MGCTSQEEEKTVHERENETGDQPALCLPSKGSVGHPHSCALPCKFTSRPQGCCRGADCDRCHLCEWKGRGLNPYPKNKDGTPWVYKPPPEKKPEKRSGPRGLAEAEATAEILGGQICTVGIMDSNQEYFEVFGTVAPTRLEQKVLHKFAPGFDLTCSREAVLAVQEHLMTDGFTSAPNSSELISIVRQIPEQDIDTLRRTRMTHSLHSSRIAKASIAQLKRALPASFAVAGLYKARARTCKPDNAASLHKDDVLLTEGELTKALFPSQAISTAVNDEGFFDRYKSFCEDARNCHPSLDLPSSPAVLEKIARAGDLRGLTRQLISSIRGYNEKQSLREDELIFDNVNLWIPRDTKQIMLLPLEHSCGLQYPLCPDDARKLETSFAGKFQALPKGVALIFFGQSVLHQALMGADFDCGTGSLEGRYLVLTTRRYAHSGSLRDHLGEDVDVGIGAGEEPEQEMWL